MDSKNKVKNLHFNFCHVFICGFFKWYKNQIRVVTSTVLKKML